MHATLQSIEILIDYLTITKPGLSLGSEHEVFAYIHDYDNSQTWESMQAPRPYRYGIKTDTGAIGGSSHAGQGTLLSWSGSALQKTDALAIGRTALANQWRITRLDCTVDFLGFDTLVEDYLQEYKHGQANTQAKSHDNHTSEDNGHTVYIGSWDSERYLRIYNKTASEARFTDISTLPEKWLRCELVLRAEHARSAFSFILDRGIREAIPAILRGYCDFPNIEEYAEMSKQTVTTTGKGKRESNRQMWLSHQVFPALIAEMRLDPEFAHDFMSRIADALSDLQDK